MLQTQKTTHSAICSVVWKLYAPHPHKEQKKHSKPHSRGKTIQEVTAIMR